MSYSGGAPQREQPNPPKLRRGFTFDVQNAHRATTRATQPAKSPQGVHFRCSKCAPRHNESNPTRQKSAEGSKCAPRHNESNPTRQKSAEGSLSTPRHNESNPTRQKSAEGSLSMFKMRTAPRREQPNPLKVRRGFTFDVQNAHRATTRATQPAKSPQRVHFRCSKCAPRHGGTPRYARIWARHHTETLNHNVLNF